MSTTLSMWLGIAFLLLAIVAVLLQAWLWGPKFWDEDAKKTRAPKFWLRVHAFAGYTYGLIYVFMMWHMLPRLWEYQYELPARTVIHAVLAIAIGVLLITKIMILLFFRHFEEAMPRYGFGLLICTVAMITLSVPYALRAQDLSGRTSDPDNIERVQTLLAEVDLGPDTDISTLTSAEGFERGREVLVRKCVTCHDMRTIIAKPRTAKSWLSVNTRMLDKPAIFGERLLPADIPFVTAYMVAITPEIQKSAKQKREDSREEEQRTDRIVEAVHEAQPPAQAIDKAAGEALLQRKCIDCHDIEETEAHGGDDVAGWRSVIASMVEEGAELTDEEVDLLSAYLTLKYPSTATSPATTAENGEADEQEGSEPAPTPTEAEDGDEAATEGDGGTEGDSADQGEDSTAQAEPPESSEPEPEPKAKPKPKAQPKPKPKPKAKPKKPAAPKADKAAGRAVFLKKCKTCHGADGKGDTPFGRKLGVASLAGSGRGRAKIRAIIANGVPGTKMKPYKGKLSDAELDNVAAFVKGL